MEPVVWDKKFVDVQILNEQLFETSNWVDSCILTVCIQLLNRTDGLRPAKGWDWGFEVLRPTTKWIWGTKTSSWMEPMVWDKHLVGF